MVRYAPKKRRCIARTADPFQRLPLELRCLIASFALSTYDTVCDTNHEELCAMMHTSKTMRYAALKSIALGWSESRYNPSWADMVGNKTVSIYKDLTACAPSLAIADVQALRLSPKLASRVFSLYVSRKWSRVEDVAVMLDTPGICALVGGSRAVADACGHGNIDVARLLLSHDTVFNATGHENYAIRLACQRGRIEAVRLLVAIPEVDASTSTNIPIGVVSQRGHLEIARLLLTRPEVDASDDDNYALRMAGASGHLGIVRLLMANSRVAEACTSDFFRSIIHVAITHGHTKLVSYFSALLGDADRAAFTPRFAIDAARQGRLDIVRILVEQYDADVTYDDCFAFREACSMGNLKTARYLYTLPGVDAAAIDNEAFRYSANNGRLDVVRFLSTIPGVDASDLNNQAIRLASSNGHLEIVRLLSTTPGVDATANDSQAIRWASSCGHLEVVRLLLSLSGVDAAANDSQAIQWASENGHLKVVRLLAALPEVDASARNNVAIRCARAGSFPKVVRFLLTLPSVRNSPHVYSPPS